MSEPPAVRRIHVISNPISGVASGGASLPRFVDAARSLGIEAEVTLTEAAGHGTEIARQVSETDIDCVVAVGGDGTVNDVLNGMRPGPVALTTVPTGTSNMLARELRIPFDPEMTAKMVARGNRQRMDVGLANGRRFLMVVGVGWDATVVNHVSAARTGHLGQLKYVEHIARAVLEYDFPRLRVTVGDEAEPRSANLVFACNTRNYAAWFALTPDALPDDGVLDFLLLRDGAARNYLKWAIAAFTGTLPQYREVDYEQGVMLRVTSDKPVPWQIDGDPGGETPLTVSLAEMDLEVIVP